MKHDDVHSQGRVDESTTADERRQFADAVRYYLQLSPRQLPSRFLYDTLGSALFDAICQLPWYRITKAELGLLQRHARQIGSTLGSRARIVELGSGNGEKLAATIAGAGIRHVHAHLIDLSTSALEHAAQALARVDTTDIRVTLQCATYEEGLLTLPSEERDPTLMLFLGSNVGNFDPPGAVAFLGLVRAALRPGDYLLLGADLVKPERELLLAYDDPLGVTAAFNKNLLLRVNRELDADFDLDRFAHRAVWNAAESRVEMHLVSLANQEVNIPGCDLPLRLEVGDTIWTESSYKYNSFSIARLVEAGAFVQRNEWLDQQDGFALMLFQAM